MICIYRTPDESATLEPKFGFCWFRPNCSPRHGRCFMFTEDCYNCSLHWWRMLRARGGLSELFFTVREDAPHLRSDNSCNLKSFKTHFQLYFPNYKMWWLDLGDSILGDSKFRVFGIFIGIHWSSWWLLGSSFELFS